MKKTSHKFNQVSQPFNYAREVRQVWRDFPETKDKIRFLDLCAEDMLVYPDTPRSRKAARTWVNDNKNLLQAAEKFRKVEKSSCFMPWHGAMLLYTQKHKYSFLDRRAARAMETMFVFDHELGHALIPGALYTDGRNKAECIADAYGAIRHLQRYGAASHAIDALVGQRALQFIFKEDRASHLTSPVIEQILARRNAIAWDKLSPQETQRLARRFALEYALHPLALNELDQEFKKLQGKMDAVRAGDAAPLQELADKVLSAVSPDVFKYGAIALQFCLDGRFEGLKLRGEYWDDIRQKLTEKQKAFATQDKLLFGLGANDNRTQDPPPKQDTTGTPIDYLPLANLAPPQPKR